MEGEFTNEIIEEMIADVKAPKVYRLTALDVLIESDLQIATKHSILAKFDSLIR